jgi:hypothetical protein
MRKTHFVPDGLIKDLPPSCQASGGRWNALLFFLVVQCASEASFSIHLPNSGGRKVFIRPMSLA